MVSALVAAAGTAAATGAVAYYENGLFGLFGSDKPDYSITTITNPDMIRTKTGPIGGAYVLARNITHNPPPGRTDSCVGRYTWAHHLGGVDADSTTAETTVEGRSNRVVTITGIDVAVKKPADDPKPGSFVTCRGRGETPPIETVAIDLDQSPPTVTVTNPQGKKVPPTFTVRAGQTENFLITAHTNKADVRWHPVLHLEVGGKAKQVPILSDGKDFETTSSSAALPYRWLDNAWRPQAIGGNTGPTPTVAPAKVNACQALDPALVRALIGAGAQVQTGGGGYQQTQGVKVPLAVSTCSLLAPGPASGGALPSVTLLVNAAATEQEAATEYAAEVMMFGRTDSPLHPIRGLGDAAATGNGLVLVRHGRFVINTQVNPAKTSQQADLLKLSRRAVDTVS